MSEMNADERLALEPIADSELARIETLLAWSAINSGSENIPGLARMAKAAAEAFSTLAPVHLSPAAEVSVVGEDGAPTPSPRGANLTLSVRPEAPVQVLLAGHMDTVFPVTDPFQTPVWREAGVINGPGAADMKGGLLVMLAALEAFEASPWRDRLGWRVVINSDEEISSLGSAALLTERAAGADLGLVFEPAMDETGALASARKGIGGFTLVARGLSAHAGRNPEDGRNAVVAAAIFAAAAARIGAERPGASVNIARIEGGGPTNVVPDFALCRLEARAESEADRAFVEAALRQAAARTAVETGVSLVLEGRFTRPPKPFDPKTEALFDAVRRCGADLGQPISWRPSGGCCDGNNLAAAGLTVVDTLGVRGGRIHSRDEYMIAASLAERAALSALLLMRLASGAIAPPTREGRPGRDSRP